MCGVVWRGDNARNGFFIYKNPDVAFALPCGDPDPRHLRTAVGHGAQSGCGHSHDVVQVERVDARAPGRDRKKGGVGNLDDGKREGEGRWGGEGFKSNNKNK